MSSARYIVGDALTVLRGMPDASVDCVITSPPYLNLRSYLPAEHPEKMFEMGQEDTPADYLESMLVIMDELWRVLADHGTYWINLGDTHAGSGGAGGDYNQGGLREGQAKFDGTAVKARRNGVNGSDRGRQSRNRWRSGSDQWPREQSVCWIPHMFGASLAYGRNLLAGIEHQQWVTRPPVTWCKPNPPVGQLTRTFRTATELIIYGGKVQQHYFDLDGVRYDPPPENERTTWNQTGPTQRLATDRSDLVTGRARFTQRIVNPAGAPPLNWWTVPTQPYSGAHFAVFPEELIVRPVIAGCPEHVCTTCQGPVVRIVDNRYVDDPDDRTRRKHTGRLNGKDHPPERGWQRSHETVGWTCLCPYSPGDTRPGIILDPFAGSGTTGAVAIGHGRDFIGIDIDERNAWLARDRVGMFLTIEEHVSPQAVIRDWERVDGRTYEEVEVGDIL